MLTDSDVLEFEQNGAVCLRNVFSKNWIDKVTKGIQFNLSSPSPLAQKHSDTKGSGGYFDDYCNWSRIPEFQEFIFQSPAAKIATILMKSQFAVFYHDHVLNKEPGTTKSTPWHHDQPYYPFDGSKTCSIWLPVDPVPVETSLKFVKGSHKWGRRFIPRKFATENNYSIINDDDYRYEDVPDIDGNPEKFEILCWKMQPGDCIAFHMMTLHGARGNLSMTTHRRVLSTRWLGDDVVFASRPWGVSPPITCDLQPGDAPHLSQLFPVIWKQN